MDGRECLYLLPPSVPAFALHFDNVNRSNGEEPFVLSDIARSTVVVVEPLMFIVTATLVGFATFVVVIEPLLLIVSVAPSTT